MKDAGIRSKIVLKFKPNTTDSKHAHPVAENVLDAYRHSTTSRFLPLPIVGSIDQDAKALNRSYAERPYVRQQAYISPPVQQPVFRNENPVPSVPQNAPQFTTPATTQWVGVVAVKNGTAAECTYEIQALNVDGVLSDWRTISAKKGEQWLHYNPECVEFHVRVTRSDGSQESYRLPAAKAKSAKDATDSTAKKYKVVGNRQSPLRLVTND